MFYDLVLCENFFDDIRVMMYICMYINTHAERSVGTCTDWFEWWRRSIDMLARIRVTRLGEFYPLGDCLLWAVFMTEICTHINFGLWNFFIHFDKNGFSYLLGDLFTNSSGHLPRVSPTYTVPRGQISHKTFLCNRKNNVQLIKCKQKSYLQLQNKKQIFFSVWNLCK
jgi:hypothetical protein